MNFGQLSPFGFGSAGTGGGGSGTLNFISVTKAQLDTLIGASGLTPGSFYKITDRGDLGILVQATSVNTISINGVRYMLCPSDYTDGAVFGASTSIGMWHILKTVAAGNVAIWGGLFWVNTSGNIGTADSQVALSAADWTVIPKASFANGEYTPKQFGCQYDYANDWIQSQWDTRGNVFGVSNYYAVDNGLTYNPVDASDWNIATIAGSSFNQNVCYGFYNNQAGSGSPSFVRNIRKGLIYANSVSIDLTDNIVGSDITGNAATGSIGGLGNLRSNANNGAIIGNTMSGLGIEGNVNNGSIINNTGSGKIVNNENNGSISENVLTDEISSNANNGDISGNQISAGTIVGNKNNGDIINNTTGTSIIGNTNDGDIDSNANTDIISKNSNSGNISGNTGNVVGISFNSNLGNIATNSNTGGINFNTSHSHITLNSCTGAIENNSNRGTIASNSNAGVITFNANNGVISANANAGGITFNENNGDISANAVTVTDIDSNINNGDITLNSASVGTIAITTNTNNGDISGAFAADVTDPVVNKP